MSKVLLPPELNGAFSIFVEELNKHVAYLSEILQQLQLLASEDCVEPISSARAAQLENRFHKIKGGSGFLGLTEIEQLVTKGELLFKEHEGDNFNCEKLSRELGEILASLEEARANL